jgi:DNA-binding LacI/PurR family transcriptional regulator/signal transduction histidine kinase
MEYASKPSTNTRRIGVFIGRIDDSFQSAIWRSITSGAAEAGVEIVGFLGHGLGSPVSTQATMNIVYRMAGKQNLDALIVLSNTVGNFAEPESISALIKSTGLPSVSIAYDIEGCPTAVARGSQAMRDIVRHLAREHGRRDFALVTGPRRHVDSAWREAAFREALAEEGIAFDERLLYEGRFYKESGSEAALAFLDSGLGFDAMVCLNDYMALGALKALRSRGIAVPDQVSVTGFDDIDEARWSSPPLTTVRQPIPELGRAALDLAIALLDGRGVESRYLECRFVPRRSCGCISALPLPYPSGEEEGAILPWKDDSARAISLLADSNDTQGILKILEEELAKAHGGGDAFESLRSMLYDLRSRRGDRDAKTQVTWFDQALAFLGEAEKRKEVERNIAASERYILIRDLGTQLLETFRLDALVRQWELCIESLGIESSYLVLFEGPVEPGGQTVPEKAVLVSSPCAGKGSVSGGIARTVFPAALLFPPGLPDRPGRLGWIVEPLVYQDEALGYLLIDSTVEDTMLYESLREHMSTAVKATLLMEEIQEGKRSLEHQVELRTEELRRANRDLKTQIAQRRELELEVQDISNRTMQSIGQDIHDDLCQHLVGISMLAAALEEGIEAGTGESLESIREIRGLLESAVTRSRQFARTLYPPSLEEFGLVNALEELAVSLSRPSSGVSISFQAEGDCRVEDPAQALQLYRIVQEALANAQRHSGSEVVLLRLFKREGLLVAEVRDFGRGLGTADKDKDVGMGLRIMRYRADSIGARLEIRNLDPGVCVSCELGERG